MGSSKIDLKERREILLGVLCASFSTAPQPLLHCCECVAISGSRESAES